MCMYVCIQREMKEKGEREGWREGEKRERKGWMGLFCPFTMLSLGTELIFLGYDKCFYTLSQGKETQV